MSLAMSGLSQDLQRLIDARLDTIDRMLLGRVPRDERLAIVREVETQIFDLLAEQGGDSPDRETVLTVLSRLDPPEAYLPEGESAAPRSSGRVATSESPVARVPSPSLQEKRARWSFVSGILGLAGMGLTLLAPIFVYFIIRLLGDVAVVGWIGYAAAMLITSMIGLAYATVARLSRGWAVAGLVCSLLTLLASVALVAFLLLELSGWR